jgi:hypothetical protein
MSWLEDRGARLDEDELAREVELERRARHAPAAAAVATWERLTRVRVGEATWERATLSLQGDELLIEFKSAELEPVAITLEQVRGILGPA